MCWTCPLRNKSSLASLAVLVWATLLFSVFLYYHYYVFIQNNLILMCFLCMQVTSLSHYVHCQTPFGDCIKGIRCDSDVGGTTTPVKYNVYEDPFCTTLLTATALDCPGTTAARCYGGKVGISKSSAVVGSGPCLPPPSCSAAGSFPVDFQGKRGKQFKTHARFHPGLYLKF